MSVYANAADVAIRTAQGGSKALARSAYIPSVNYKSKADKNFVQNMVASGTPIGEVADMVGFTPRRIYQIQKKNQKAGVLVSLPSLFPSLLPNDGEVRHLF